MHATDTAANKAKRYLGLCRFGDSLETFLRRCLNPLQEQKTTRKVLAQLRYPVFTERCVVFGTWYMRLCHQLVPRTHERLLCLVCVGQVTLRASPSPLVKAHCFHSAAGRTARC